MPNAAPRLLLFAVLACSCCGAEPIALSDDWGNIEGTWRFRTDPSDVGEQEGWQAVDHADAEGWRDIEAPGHWEAQGVTDPRPGEAPKPKDGMPWSDYDGIAWYRLRFVVPKEWRGKELVFSLGSVDDQDRTFLNGRLVGETGPGLERSVSVQRRYTVAPDLVRFGEENVLAVRVTDGGGPGGLMGPLLTLLPADAGIPHLSQDDRPLAERFADPPASCRILKIIHGWPDEPAAQDDTIKGLISQGFGGVVCNVSFDQYMRSEAKWQAFVRAVNEAKKAGMSMWLYDEQGYPSGTASDLTLQGHPEWEAEGLLIAEATTDGTPVEVAAPPGEIVSALAYPLSDAGIRMDGAIDVAAGVAGGKLTWTPPAGKWRVLAITKDRLYEGTHASMSLAYKHPYINLLMPEPTKRFLELTHDEYARRLGPNLGRWFVATFTDEPSLMSYFLGPMPYSVLPWAPGLPEEFRKRRGYDLSGVLPLLVSDAGGAERKARVDYWRTVGELVAESFFGQIQERCRELGFQSGGHLLIEESFLAQVALYGDFYGCIRRLDAPSIDCLTSVPGEVPWYSARLLSSAGELEGRATTMCETSDFGQVYRPQGDTRPARQVTEEEIRGTCNRLMMNGINTITSYYSFAGIDGRQLRSLNEWVGRCCTVLRGGHQVTDVALLYPIESVWPKFTPSRQGDTNSPAAQAVSRVHTIARDSLYAGGRDFTYVDGRALAEAKVEDGELVSGNLRWRMVVLPGTDTLPLAAWRNIERFWREGGAVIAVGARPANSDEQFPCPEVESIARTVFGESALPGTCANAAGGVGVYLPTGSESLLPVILDRVLAKDVDPCGTGTGLHATHRRIDGAEVYFVINDAGSPWQGDLSVSASGKGELMDPGTGTTTRVADASRIPVDLAPYGGVVLRFESALKPDRRAVPSGALPGLVVSVLPAATPEMGKGEFVQAVVTPGQGADGLPMWAAAATLTQSDTDTFLFLGFRYPDGLDLSGAACLVLDTTVPEGQTTPTRMLVILVEKDGGQYLVDTGRSLSAPGAARSYVSLSAFAPAGWASDPDGRLDLSRIVAVSIGWGGYLGKEGDTVSFTLAQPRSARLEDGTGDQ